MGGCVTARHWILGLALSLAIPAYNSADAAPAKGKAAVRAKKARGAPAGRRQRPMAPTKRLTKSIPKKADAVAVTIRGRKVKDSIGKPAIVNAVKQGFRAHLEAARPSGFNTVADWNRLDPKSIVVKSVEIHSRAEVGGNHLGYRLEPGERGFTAVVEVARTGRFKGQTMEVQLKSTIFLGKTIPRLYGIRVAYGRTGMRAEDTRYLGDTTTVGWID